MLSENIKIKNNQYIDIFNTNVIHLSNRMNETIIYHKNTMYKNTCLFLVFRLVFLNFIANEKSASNTFPCT